VDDPVDEAQVVQVDLLPPGPKTGRPETHGRYRQVPRLSRRIESDS
jgi:hypothetical protein